jgi:hypothetical protein
MLKRALIVISVDLLLALTVPRAVAQDSTLGMFYTGNEYLSKLTSTTQLAFIAGVLDGYAFQTWGNPTARQSELYRCLTQRLHGLTLGQAHAIVDAHLKATPQDWNLPMVALVYSALTNVCK